MGKDEKERAGGKSEKRPEAVRGGAGGGEQRGGGSVCARGWEKWSPGVITRGKRAHVEEERLALAGQVRTLAGQRSGVRSCEGPEPAEAWTQETNLSERNSPHI